MGVLFECPIFLWVYFSSYADIEAARTKIFLLFVFVEMVVSLGFVSLRYSIFEARPHKWLLLAIGWELALLAVLIQFPIVRETFGIGMPTAGDLVMVLFVSAAVLLTIELTKAYLRAGEKSGAQAPAPALQPAIGETTMRKILVPVDGSPNSAFALRHVIARFMNNTAMEVHLLNVQVPFSAHVARFTRRSSRQDYHREQAEKALRPARAMLDKHSIPYAAHMEVGDRATLITAAARRLRCDEIVIATARKNSLTRLVESSVTERVLELTRVPVVVIAGDSMSRWERFGIPVAIAALIAFVVAD